MHEEWIKEISLDDLEEKNREIAEIIGIENFIELCKYYGGATPIYFNKLSKILDTIRNKKILEEYNKYNVDKLGRKYNLSSERIRQIIRAEEMEKSQISLFDVKK